MVAHADEIGIPRSGAIKMQAPVHQHASTTTRDPTMQPCTCMCARACFLMRVCACMHGSKPTSSCRRPRTCGALARVPTDMKFSTTSTSSP
jgi:hypothetical protein